MAILRNTQVTGSFEVSGSLVVPSQFPVTPPTGTMVYASPNLYIYNGAAWDTASLS